MPISARTFAQAARFTPYQTLLAGLLAFLQFAVITDCLIIAPLGAVVMPALAISPGEFGMIVSAHTFSAGLGGLLVAGVADRFDHRRLLLLFCAGFVGGATWSGLAADFATLLMARIVAGFSGGAVAAAISAVVADLCQPRLHSRLTGIIQSAFAAVQIVGLPVGLYLSVAGTWHAPFLVLAAMGMACGCLILLWMQPVTAERAAEAERYSLIDVLRTVSVPRFAPGFAVMGLMTMGTYLVFPFSSAFAVSNLGIPFETLPAIYLIAGLGTIACGIFVGRTTHSAGMWPAFVTSNALAVSVVLIYANLVDASLAMVAALNFLMFAGLFARVVALRSLLGYIPRLPHRRSFNIASIAVHFFAGGLAACVAGKVVSFGAEGELKQFEMLGYVFAALTAVATVLAWKVCNAIPGRSE